jgi:hypothetical protein
MEFIMMKAVPFILPLMDVIESDVFYISDWQLIDNQEIVHTNGFKIVLNAGSWQVPEDIRPTLPHDLELKPFEVAKHIREGLHFARNQS